MRSQNVFAVWYVNIDSLLGAAQHETAHICLTTKEKIPLPVAGSTIQLLLLVTGTQKHCELGSCHVVCRMPGKCDVICGTTCGERERIKQCILMLSPVGLNSYNELAWVGCHETI